jgi:hypothetical protein
MADFSVKITGLRELFARLQQLPIVMRGPALERALHFAAVPIRDGAVARARRLTGKLASSIDMWTVERAPDRTVVAVGVKRLPYAHLVEYGHRLVARGGKGGKGREIGQVAARRFLRPAFDETGNQVLARLSSRLGEELDRVVLATGLAPAA